VFFFFFFFFSAQMPRTLQVGNLVICRSNRARGRRGRILEISRENRFPKFRVDFGAAGELWMFQRALLYDAVGGDVGEVAANYDPPPAPQRPRNLAVEFNPPIPLPAENSEEEDDAEDEIDDHENE
jgi:hypothetical protein